MRELDLDYFSIQSETMPDYEADEILRRRQAHEDYELRMANRPPDPRPMCEEQFKDWHCMNHASTTYKGAHLCKIHSAMRARGNLYPR